MKKTKQTLMTAAMLTAALNMATGTGHAQRLTEQESYNAEAETDVTEVYEPSEELIQDVYGPEPWYEEETTIEQETLTATTTYDPRMEIEVPVYGPPSWFTTATVEDLTEPEDDTTTTVVQPATEEDTTIYEPSTELVYPVYGPAPLYGDLNYDNRIDAFDLVFARKLLTGDYSYYYDGFYADVNNDGQFTVADLVLMSKFVLGEIKDFSEYDAVYEEPYGVYGPPEWFGLE